MAVDTRVTVSIKDRYSVRELDFRLRYYGIGSSRIMEGGSYYGKYSNGFTDLTRLVGRFDPRRYYFSETNYICVCVNMIVFIIVVVLDLAESCASGDYKRRFSIVSYVNER